jgi:2-polyprenyl-3-methyl-5-hydroxy-6-metoxy-1,4-benzoquinol methylase
VSDSFFQNYSEKHVHFYDEAFPAFLELGFALIGDVEKPSIVDLGCGDGRLLFALHKKGLLNRFSEIVGVDISAERIGRMAKALPFVKGVVSDASNVKDYPSSFFDYVICSQVIEHVQDDGALVAEIRRLLKCGGVAFISSVIKRWYGFYFYSCDGTSRLDPTHVREYSSVDEFVSLMQAEGVEVIYVETHQIMFPLLDLLLRLFVKSGLIEPEAGFFRKHTFLGKMRGFRTPVVGYKNVAVLVRKIE